jgi:Disulphide bond corrector protein DsbC
MPMSPLLAPLVVMAALSGGGDSGDPAKLRAEDVSSVTFRWARHEAGGASHVVTETDQYWLLADFKMAPGWHIYWKNPGDSGIPTSIKVTSKDKSLVRTGELQFPIPKKFDQPGGLIGYGYEDHVTLAVPVEFAAGSVGGVKVDVSAIWLVCKEVCLPGHASARVELGKVGGPSVTAAELGLPAGVASFDGETVRAPFAAPEVTVTADGPNKALIKLKLQLPTGAKVTDVFPLPAEETELVVARVTHPKAGDAVIEMTSTSYSTGTSVGLRSKALVVVDGPAGRQAGWVEFGAVPESPATRPSDTLSTPPGSGR